MVLFLLIMIVSMRRAFRTARTATADSFATIEQQTGLRFVARDGARSRMEGTYRGRQVTVDTDASGVTRAAYGATRDGARRVARARRDGRLALVAAVAERRIAWRAKAMIDAAPIKLRWFVHLPADLPGRTAPGSSS